MSAPAFAHDGRFRHRKDPVNGISLHSVVGGEGSAILLLHGWPQTWWEWRHLLPRLAGKHAVIAVDLRGFGDSSKPPPEAGYDVATLCQDLCELLDAQGHSTATVIGHDLGGLVAYAMARLHPQRVERLVVAGERMTIPLLFFGGSTTLGKVFEPHLDQIATDFRVAVVPDSGHWMPEENPDFVLAQLDTFMSGGVPAHSSQPDPARVQRPQRTGH